MSDLSHVFETELYDCWSRRDFDDWLAARSIYADWLEENDHPLAPMARCSVSTRPSVSNLKNGEKRPWMWRLFFNWPRDRPKPRPRWWTNLRFNGARLLGFPPYTLRCKWFEECYGYGVWFTVVFKPHRETYWISNTGRRMLSGFEERPVAVDLDLHADGFAALFWPGERTPTDWKQGTREQKTLF